jgi:hypothetical protein
VIDPPALALRYPDTWAYSSIDTDDDGCAELLHVDGAELATLHFDTGSDLLTEITNGRGATTRVGYRSLPTVVDKVTISDAAHDPPVAETTSWVFEGARWSDERNKLLDFE